MTVPRSEAAGALLTALALVLAAAYAPRRAAARGADPGAVYRASLCAVLGGVIGGHALWVATHGGGGVGGWLAFWDAGQSVFGVLAGAMLAGGAYAAWRGLPLLACGDLGATAAALGYAVARVGCFVNGDDFGAPSALPWAVRYAAGSPAWSAHVARGWIGGDAPASLPIHPVQLYLALVGAGLFLVLHRVRLRPGAALGIASLGYGAARLALEPLRDDFARVAGPFSLPQLLALALAACGAGLLVRAYARRGAREGLDRGDAPSVTSNALTHSRTDALSSSARHAEAAA
jgi:phosphatidylglycerol---prolipoprotein diacylglyceryl transferase